MSSRRWPFRMDPSVSTCSTASCPRSDGMSISVITVATLALFDHHVTCPSHHASDAVHDVCDRTTSRLPRRCCTGPFRSPLLWSTRISRGILSTRLGPQIITYHAFNPFFQDVKLMQSLMLMCELASFISSVQLPFDSADLMFRFRLSRHGADRTWPAWCAAT